MKILSKKLIINKTMSVYGHLNGSPGLLHILYNTERRRQKERKSERAEQIRAHQYSFLIFYSMGFLRVLIKRVVLNLIHLPPKPTLRNVYMIIPTFYYTNYDNDICATTQRYYIIL